MPVNISVIIPTLNEADSIGYTLAAVEKMEEDLEAIVVDGGSTDDTVEIARRFGVTVLHSPRGRGIQMHTGAQIATAGILWFLHADTVPELETAEKMRIVLRDPNVVAGNFTIKFDGDTHAAKFLTWLYPQLRKWGLIYGDSAIFVRREVYERIGGFKPYPIFEDLDLISRLKREGEIVTLPAPVHTSSRRFEGRSFIFTFLRWIVLQVLYWLGMSPVALGRSYLPLRRK